MREKFPQVNHVRCFSGRNERGEGAPGHVTVVIAGYGRNGEGTEALCAKVYRYLAENSSCCLVAEDRLHVCPATVLTVNTSVTVKTERPELAAETQQAIARRLESLIRDTWKKRPIGEQLRLHRDGQVRVPVDEGVLPCEQQRVGRCYGMPKERFQLIVGSW